MNTKFILKQRERKAWHTITLLYLVPSLQPRHLHFSAPQRCSKHWPNHEVINQLFPFSWCLENLTRRIRIRKCRQHSSQDLYSGETSNKASPLQDGFEKRTYQRYKEICPLVFSFHGLNYLCVDIFILLHKGK